MDALIVGHADPAAALTSALCESGIDAHLHGVPRATGPEAVASLARALVDLERVLAEERPALAVAVGEGDAPIALAVSASKLGIPLVAWIEANGPAGPEAEQAKHRILATLAAFDAGEVGDGAQAHEAARRIVAWANLD